MSWRTVLEEQSFREDDDLDIAATLLALAEADRRASDLSAERAHLDALADGLDGPASAEALSGRLADDLGYRGDDETYDDMRNADIVDVIARRRGLPVALGLLYIHTGRTLGWDISGMSFPGHFLLRLQTDDGPRIIDAFDQGRVLQMREVKLLLQRMTGQHAELSPVYLGSVPVRHVLVRLQNNIKVRALQAGDTDRGTAILERMSLFAPAESSIWLEWSGIEAARGNLQRALGLIEEGANHAPTEAALQAMANARRGLKERLN